MRIPHDARFARYDLRYLGTDARSLLTERKIRNVDDMSEQQRTDFQQVYFRKKSTLERSFERFVTDRSFVDVAAYWIEYTGRTDDAFVSQCEYESKNYDVHLYFPPGVISFESDGYRSADAEVHRRIDESIVRLLHRWRIDAITLMKIDIEDRLNEVLHRLEARDA
jgi:nicotinamide riboside kinase